MDLDPVKTEENKSEEKTDNKEEGTKEENKDGEKKGSLTLTDLILMGLGNIVGAGVFVIIGKSIKYGGKQSTYALLVVTVISIIMGFCYMEIYSRFKSNITEYLAVKDTLGENLGQISLYSIYLFALFSGVTIVISISKYLSNSGFLPKILTGSKVFETIFSIILLVVMSGINYMGIETSKFVASTISIIMLIVLGGLIALSSTSLSYDKIFVAPPSVPWDSFVLSSILSLFLFNGYDFIIKISGEVKNKSDTNTGLIATLGITSVIYLLIIAAGLCVLKYKTAATTYNIISKLYEVLTNKTVASIVFLLGALIMFNTGFLSVMSATKFMQGCGKEKNIAFPDFWAKENANKSPINAIIVSFIICLFFAVLNNEVLMAVFSNFSAIFILILISVALLICRWREKDDLKSQQTHNFIYGNIGNMPIIVILNLLVLFYIMYLMFKNRFWIGKI